MSSLWPEDIGVPDQIRAPKTILLEQAKGLKEKTKDYVTAEVTRLEEDFGWGASDVHFGFFLVASRINYRYRLFNAAYLVTELYPVLIKLDEEMAGDVTAGTVYQYNIFGNNSLRSVGSEEELLTFLGQVFASSKTRRVVKAILAQIGVRNV